MEWRRLFRVQGSRVTNKNYVVYGSSWLIDQRYYPCSRYTLDSKYADLGFRVVQDPQCRVLRGGSWYNCLGYLRVENCYYGAPWNNFYGFRVVRDG